MKGKNNIVLFLLFIIMIAILIFFINRNMEKIIPDYIGTIQQYEINTSREEESFSIRDKIYTNMGGGLNIKPISADSEDSHKNDEIVKTVKPLMGRILGEREYISSTDMVFFQFDIENEIGATGGYLQYTLDYSTVYYYNNIYDIYFTEQSDELLNNERKKEIIEKCKAEIIAKGLELLELFEPDTIWRLPNNIYVLRDNANNKIVNYNWSENKIVGFSIEPSTN